MSDKPEDLRTTCREAKTDDHNGLNKGLEHIDKGGKESGLVITPIPVPTEINPRRFDLIEEAQKRAKSQIVEEVRDRGVDSDD